MLLEQLFDLGAAIVGVVALRAAAESLVEDHVRIVDADALDVQADGEVLARHAIVPHGGVERLELALDVDQLKEIYIEGELEPIDTAQWYPKMQRKDYAVALNLTGSGVDDPDQQFFENYACGSLRNYSGYCNPELDKKFVEQSQMTDQEARKKLVWEIDKKLQLDVARPVIVHDWGGTCWQPAVKGVNLAVNSIYNHWRFEDVWLDR